MKNLIFHVFLIFNCPSTPDLILLNNLTASINCQTQKPPPKITPNTKLNGNGTNKATPSHMATLAINIIMPRFL